MTNLKIIGAVTAVAVLGPTGCGDDGAEPAEESTTAAVESVEETYPVTVEMAHGEITLEEQPERIAVLFPKHGTMLASSGVQPLVVPDDRDIDSPWLDHDAIYEDSVEFDDDLVADVSTGEISLETVAAYEPDLIVAVDSQIDAAVYEQASAIAPTYVEGNAGREDWDEVLRELGTLTGHSEQAEEVIEEIDDQYAQARESLAGLQGATVSFLAYFPEQEFAYGNSSWLHGFGLTPANEDEAAGNQNTAGRISQENIEELDADVLVIQVVDPDSQEALESDPRFAEIPASQNDAVIFIDPDLAIATAMPDPYRLTWAIDEFLLVLENTGLNQETQ